MVEQQPGDEATGPARVVVGVDGSERNLSAVEWAVRESLVRRQRLHLVSVATGQRDDPADLTATARAEAEDLLRRVQRRARAAGAGDDTTLEVRLGRPAEQLVDVQRPGDLLVVGRRGGGMVHRLVLGSTSSRLLAGATGPVVVVPDHSSGADGSSGDVVAACDGSARDADVVGFALEEAALRGGRVVAVSALSVSPLLERDAAELERMAKETELRLGEHLAPFRDRQPGVEVECRTPVEKPAHALARTGAEASMVVLGRSRTRATGAVPSLAQRLLHLGRGPLVVVPTAAPDAHEFDFDEEDVPEF